MTDKLLSLTNPPKSFLPFAYLQKNNPAYDNEAEYG